MIYSHIPDVYDLLPYNWLSVCLVHIIQVYRTTLKTAQSEHNNGVVFEALYLDVLYKLHDMHFFLVCVNLNKESHSYGMA